MTCPIMDSFDEYDAEQDQMEADQEEMDPVLESLADLQPADEPMSLEEFEDREARISWHLEDERAKEAAKQAWAMRRKAA